MTVLVFYLCTADAFISVLKNPHCKSCRGGAANQSHFIFFSSLCPALVLVTHLHYYPSFELDTISHPEELAWQILWGQGVWKKVRFTSDSLEQDCNHNWSISTLTFQVGDQIAAVCGGHWFWSSVTCKSYRSCKRKRFWYFECTSKVRNVWDWGVCSFLQWDWIDGNI